MHSKRLVYYLTSDERQLVPGGLQASIKARYILKWHCCWSVVLARRTLCPPLSNCFCSFSMMGQPRCEALTCLAACLLLAACCREQFGSSGREGWKWARHRQFALHGGFSQVTHQRCQGKSPTGSLPIPFPLFHQLPIITNGTPTSCQLRNSLEDDAG